jgi:hypothetical protein
MLDESKTIKSMNLILRKLEEVVEFILVRHPFGIYNKLEICSR